jgi:hypothetical protein
MLCLANSYKEKNRCVAGIDLKTGQFVRPVADSHSQAVPKEWTETDGRSLKPLDIVEVPIRRGDATVPYQSENRFSDEGWQIVGQAKPSDLQRHCQPDRTILHTQDSEAIPERYFRLQRRTKRTWRSLQLIAVRNVEFYEREEGKWNAKFKNQAGREFDLRVTDDHFAAQLTEDAQARQLNHGYFMLSMSRPWKHYLAARKLRKKCYKLIAGVIPVQKP